MGAWGCGPFENDDSLDWAAELGESDDPGFPASVLRELGTRARIGRRDGNVGLAAAEAIAASRGWPPDPLPEQVQEWLTATRARADARTRDLALRVVGNIGGSDDSELRLLWEEQPDGASWHEAVDDLRQRLQARPKRTSLPAVPRVRVGLGDVIELTTSAGMFAYIQLTGEMEPGENLIRVLPGLFGAPLDDDGLARLIAGESAFLSGGFFKEMITRAGGRARGNYPIPAACAAPQPLRTRLFHSPAPGSWWVEYAQREMPAEEFARLHPDIDQTMLAEKGSFPFADTLLRKIECEWRPWMDHYNISWMYPRGSKEVSRPKRVSPYPPTATRDKFLIDVE